MCRALFPKASPTAPFNCSPDGQPIILLKDRQTMGGYPKVGTLFVLDAFLLAQQQAHTEVRFTQISLEEAQEKLRYFYRFFGV